VSSGGWQKQDVDEVLYVYAWTAYSKYVELRICRANQKHKICACVGKSENTKLLTIVIIDTVYEIFRFLSLWPCGLKPLFVWFGLNEL